MKQEIQKLAHGYIDSIVPVQNKYTFIKILVSLYCIQVGTLPPTCEYLFFLGSCQVGETDTA
jgi:hypothetical protein